MTLDEIRRWNDDFLLLRKIAVQADLIRGVAHNFTSLDELGVMDVEQLEHIVAGHTRGVARVDFL